LSTASGQTIAVLASGPDFVYPRRHAALYRQIADEGLILSELPPGIRPFRWSFPARNRIMAALAEITIVVEAAEKSGSLITASFAADLGRGVCAVPGRVTARNAAGSNRLLRDGAPVIRDAADALDELFGIGAGASAEAEAARRFIDDLEPELQAVLAQVEAGHGTERMAEETGIGPAELRRALGRLEGLGLIRRAGLAAWERRAA
jgi:DNA processing protein